MFALACHAAPNGRRARGGRGERGLSRTKSRGWATPTRLPVLYGLWVEKLVRAAFEEARELGQEFLELAERRQDPAVLVAHRAIGAPCFNMGEQGRAHEHFETILSVYDPRRHRSLSYLYGQDPGVSARAFGSLPLWFLGYPDQALLRSEEGISLARELSHPLSLVYALGLRSPAPRAALRAGNGRERGEEAIALATEYGSHSGVLGQRLRGAGH